jgi:hypothetical protein
MASNSLMRSLKAVISVGHTKVKSSGLRLQDRLQDSLEEHVCKQAGGGYSSTWGLTTRHLLLSLLLLQEA